jgi:hypothetical protein
MSDEMDDTDELPAVVADGPATYHTGLLLPPAGFVSAFPAYLSSGPMLPMDDIRARAASGAYRGSTKFDRSWIKNQRNKSSCNGFAEAAALSRARVRRGLLRVDLSGAYAYSLINRGRDNGSMLEDGMRAAGERGIAPEALVPWDAIYPHLYPAAAHEEAKRYKAFECYAVRSEVELFSALASGFDCVVAVHADNGFMRLDGDGVAGGGRGPGNHAVAADGLYMVGSELVADGVNSWGTEYGADGRMGMTWARHFRTTTGNHVFYAVRSTTDDPQGTNPPPVAA